MNGWAPEVIGAISTPNTSPEAYLEVVFTHSASSRQAGQQALRRMYARTKDRDTATTWATRETQYDAVSTWGAPNPGLLQRLAALAGLIPHVQVKIYLDSAHGFLFQHHAEFAADVDAFFTRAS